MATIEDIRRIAEVEFADIVKTVLYIDAKLRIILGNGSFVDVHLSRRLPDRFGFHWECMDEAGTFYRYDNFPDKNWQPIATFPYHFHDGSQNSVDASPFPPAPIEGFRAFMEFIREKLR